MVTDSSNRNKSTPRKPVKPTPHIFNHCIGTISQRSLFDDHTGTHSLPVKPSGKLLPLLALKGHFSPSSVIGIQVKIVMSMDYSKRNTPGEVRLETFTSLLRQYGTIALAVTEEQQSKKYGRCRTLVLTVPSMSPKD